MGDTVTAHGMESGTQDVLWQQPSYALFFCNQVDWVWTLQILGFDLALCIFDRIT
jgi:hypothetical protein